MKLSRPSNFPPFRRGSLDLNTSSTFLNSSLKQALNKDMQKYSKRPSAQRSLDLDYIIRILRKSKFDRSKQENKHISKYLVSRFEYFKKLKGEFESKLERIISVLNLEEFEKNEPIIRFGEEGTKFYILLSGKISLYKPEYVKEKMTIAELVSYINLTLKTDPSGLVKERLIEANKYLGDEFLSKLSVNVNNIKGKTKYDFLIEKNVKLMEQTDGFTFGDTALIRKTKRNATIISDANSFLLSIDKIDYNQVIKEIEEKRLRSELKDFKDKFALFDTWNYIQIMKLLSYMTEVTLSQDDYLFKQNEPSEHIFFSLEGKYDVYTMTSLAWNKSFVNYIKDDSSNFFVLLKDKREKNKKELMDLYLETKQKMLESPMKSSDFESGKFGVKGGGRGVMRLNELNLEIEQLKNPFNLIRIKLSNITENIIIGLEDAIELKNRFSFVRVTSQKARLKKVRIFDFIKVLNENNSKLGNNCCLMNFVEFKKNVLLEHINKIIDNYRQFQNKKIENELKKCVLLGGKLIKKLKDKSRELILEGSKGNNDKCYSYEKLPNCEMGDNCLNHFNTTKNSFKSIAKSSNITFFDDKKTTEKTTPDFKLRLIKTAKASQNNSLKGGKITPFAVNFSPLSPKLESGVRLLTETKNYNCTLRNSSDDKLTWRAIEPKDEYNTPLLYNKNLNLNKLKEVELQIEGRKHHNKKHKGKYHFLFQSLNGISKFKHHTLTSDFHNKNYRSKIKTLEFNNLNNTKTTLFNAKLHNFPDKKPQSLLLNYTRNIKVLNKKPNFKLTFDSVSSIHNAKKIFNSNFSPTITPNNTATLNDFFNTTNSSFKNTTLTAKEFDCLEYRKKLSGDKVFFKSELKKYVGNLRLRPKIGRRRERKCGESNKDSLEVSGNYNRVTLKDINDKIKDIRDRIKSNKNRWIKNSSKYTINYLNGGIKIKVIKNK